MQQSMDFPRSGNETVSANYLFDKGQPIHVVCKTCTHPSAAHGRIMTLPLQTTCLIGGQPIHVFCKTCSAVAVLWLFCVCGSTTYPAHSTLGLSPITAGSGQFCLLDCQPGEMPESGPTLPTTDNETATAGYLFDKGQPIHAVCWTRCAVVVPGL